ncbi:MAG: xylulokinase [Defluviitaleaceae bacterium]|nr:xylulokinase [Defluviitaleaceae bacterium]
MYVLGIDLGTSSLKGLLLNKKGDVVATESSEYELHIPKSGYSEQNPQNWVLAMKIVFEKLVKTVPNIKTGLEGISFSGQMHSLIVLDEKKNVLRNAILWNDVRTTKQCQTILKELPNIVDITKNTALEGFTLPKILWIQENEPEIWEKIKYIVLPKDYLGYYLTGNINMDYSDAAGTLMLDVLNKKWSNEITDKFNIDKNILPNLVNSTDFIGNLLPNLQSDFGFEKEIKIFAGGADNACAAIGSGIVDKEKSMASIGTSGVFLTYEEKHNGYDGKLHYFNHGLKDSYYSMGVTLSAGHSLSWFKQNFSNDEDYNELLDGIEDLETNLFFTPYIVGERTPHTNSKIRGSFIGIDTNHTKKHFAKAVLEGITFSLKDCATIMESVGHKFESIVSVGGGAKNKIWLQMQADIFDSSVITLKTEQGPGFGAAMIAAVGVKWFKDLKECAKNFVHYQDKFIPNKQKVEKYKKAYEIYKTIYDSTKDICAEISEL